ncbi:MAG TPA: LuxR C-terminal-related transcriptional regulator [Solirubrobacterales bacterium]
MDGSTATLLAENGGGLIQDTRLAVLDALLPAVPPEAADEEPEVAIFLAAAHLLEGRLGDAAAQLELAERLSARVPDERRKRVELRLARTRLWLDRLREERASAREAMRPVAASEDLSPAELRVVRFLPTNLSAPEIAAELFVSANTVRTHMRHIYFKLGVHSRREAVDRARELGLLAPSRLAA